jgi:hypothetical protein
VASIYGLGFSFGVTDRSFSIFWKVSLYNSKLNFITGLTYTGTEVEFFEREARVEFLLLAIDLILVTIGVSFVFGLMYGAPCKILGKSCLSALLALLNLMKS